jgi:hypothetical protein
MLGNMTTKTKPKPRREALSDEQLAELLSLSRQADSVELKLTVPESEDRPGAGALGMDPLEAQIRQVFFFDTPELALYDAGVVARGRRVQGRGDDTVVKLRPVVPDELDARWRKLDDFGVEVDAMPGGFVCSASLKRRLGTPRVKQVAEGELPVRKLFSKPQRALFEANAPGSLRLDDLRLLGPIFVLKLKSAPRALGRKLVAEMWLYPDGSRIIELSTKCAPGEAFQVAAELRAFLTERGIDTGGEQETKTRKALDFFASRL